METIIPSIELEYNLGKKSDKLKYFDLFNSFDFIRY